jgi:hypothetical protein
MQLIETEKNVVNPWLNIWVRPRGTIRQIVDSNPDHHVMLLAILSGIFRALDNATERGFGDDLSIFAIIIMSLVFGSIGGLVSLYVGGAVFRWSGSLFGGIAPSDYVRTVIAWSSVPDVILLLIFIPIIMVFGADWFSSSPTFLEENEVLNFLLIGGVAFLGLALVLWRAFLFVKCLSEVHQFSAWKGLAASVVGILAIGIPIFILVFACGALT